MATALAVLVHGYHPGVEDDGVYLAAIHRDLNPSLYPHDTVFFALQLQATIFDKLIAASVRVSHLPLPLVLGIWHGLAIFLVLLGCLAIARRCFSEEHVQWAGVSTVAALLTLPVSGTALYLVDQYLHPRALSTAAVLFAVTATLERRYWRAASFLLLGFLLHPLMAAFGISYCLWLAWKRKPVTVTLTIGEKEVAVAVALLPLTWIWQPTSAAWRQAAQTRDYYFLWRWTWYEWLGVIAPLLLLYGFSRFARGRNRPLEHMSQRLIFFGVCQLLVAVVLMVPARFERLRPFQPMRYLHLLYLLFILFAGSLIGQYILRRSSVRWLLFFVPLCGTMFIVQRQLFPGSSHIELDGLNSRNQWVRAFAWVNDNTPRDALFALDPYYMEIAGEDYHSFRALAQRSALADYVKDPSVVTQVPILAARWQEEVGAASGWRAFQKADFEGLKSKFGVSWVLTQRPVDGLSCPYQNPAVSVCRIQ